jgi:hypothetical protein
VFIHQQWLNPRQGQGGEGWLGWGDSGQIADQHTACFCLPPGIDNRTFALADMFVVPLPGFLIDGFAHRTQDAERIKMLALQGA